MKYTEQQLNALACALATMRGTAGGYSPREHDAAITELQSMYEQAVKDVTAALESKG